MADLNKGWITLLRCIQDHEIWLKTPFGKGQAWVDLILSANHKDNKVMIGNTIHFVKRGELITSQRKLAERWGWSRNTARSFLTLLQSQRMIEQKTTHDLSHLTILNYNNLQKTSPTNLATKRPPLEQPSCHLLNTNKECNEFKELKPPIVPLTGKTASNDEIYLPYASPEFMKAWEEYLAMRKIKKYLLTATSLKLLLNKLVKLSKHSENVAISLLEDATLGEWKSVFPSKEPPRSLIGWIRRLVVCTIETKYKRQNMCLN